MNSQDPFASGLFMCYLKAFYAAGAKDILKVRTDDRQQLDQRF
jgi:hypothetical protein